ncbi:MAG: hypothetical protein Q8K92_15915 [Leadbetterella sp.]|nr:hypothetical protein [Leadbetterella sp.]
MKTFFKVLILSIFSTPCFAQSVTLEPGKSVFYQNTTESVEIKSTSVFPLTIRSTQPATGLPFFSNTNMFRGQIQGGAGGMIYSTPAKHGHSFWTKDTQRMIIDSLGNIGIGTSNPKYKFEVIGLSNTFPDTLANFDYDSPTGHKSLRIAYGGNGYLFSYNGFLGSGFGLRSKSSLEMGFEDEFRVYSPTKTLIRADNNNVSILPPSQLFGVFPLAKANLDVNNTIRSAELDFEETNNNERRPVFADKDGILRIENSSNHYASYNFSAVQAQDYDDQLRKGSGYAWFNTTSVGATMYLPINLPDGVKITNVRMFLYDNSASNLSFTLNKNSHSTNTFTAIATAQSSTNTSNVFSINDDANETVDNQNNSYYVNISSSGNWTGNTLQFHSLVITYKYQ